MECFNGATKACGISLEKKVLQDRGALPTDEGDVIGEYKAMHDENCPEQLVEGRRETQGKKEDVIMEIDKETEEEASKKRTRKEEEAENETVSAERRCVGSVSADTLDIFSHGEHSKSCGGFFLV